MKKFQVEVSQRMYRLGYYEIEAPDFEAAVMLAEDIKYGDPRIVWDEVSEPNGDAYPRPDQIYVTEVKE